MLDPSQVLSQILTNITSKAQPSRPQLPSLFDYFVDNCSVDLIQPVVIKKWKEKHIGTQMTRMNDESSFTDEGFISMPAPFFNQVAVEVFDSLSDADRLEIQHAKERAHQDAVSEYKNKMKKLYKAENSPDDRGYALEMVSHILQPIIAALEALTDLHIIGWAGGSAATDNRIGIIKISGQCGDSTESPMTFPRSQADIFRHAALEWMAKGGTQIIEQWVGDPSMQRSIAQIVSKRKYPGDDIRVLKRTRTVNPTNTHSSESSFLFLQPRPGITQSSLNTALQASLLKGQTGFQDFTVGQAHMPESFAFPTPTKTSQQAVLASRECDGHQPLNAHVRHWRGSLPPIHTPNDDEGSTAYELQAQSASEGVLQKQLKTSTNVTADDENGKYYRHLIATIPLSSRNLRYGLESLIEVDLGSSFRDIVTLLINIETLHGFKSITKGLPYVLRPSEVSSWIANGRGRRVIVVDIEEFSKAWWTWWTGMQPKWRERDAHDKPKQVTPVRAEDEDWTCLQKPGANGMISVVAGLQGWGVAIRRQTVPLGSGEKKADWLCAVEDCRWVMEHLIESLNKKEDERLEGCRPEIDVATVDDDVDYMQGDSAYRP